MKDRKSLTVHIISMFQNGCSITEIAKRISDKTCAKELTVIAILAVFFLFSITSNIPPFQFKIAYGNRFVGAYYYAWYDGNWSLSTGKYKPLLGYYASDNKTVIMQHLTWATMAGVDFLAISWSNSPKWCYGITENNCRKIFSISETLCLPVKLCIMIEYWHGEFLLNLTDCANYIYSTYASSPSYFKLYNKPLLFVYTLDDYSEPSWNDSRFTVRYIPLQVPYGKDTFLERSLQKGIVYEFTGVSPCKDNVRREIDRKKGLYYINQWENVIKFGKSAKEKTVVVMITSFNEWYESTSIEPSHTYGTKYLDLTFNFSTKFRNPST